MTVNLEEQCPEILDFDSKVFDNVKKKKKKKKKNRNKYSEGKKK